MPNRKRKGPTRMQQFAFELKDNGLTDDEAGAKAGVSGSAMSKRRQRAVRAGYVKALDPDGRRKIRMRSISLSFVKNI